MATTSSRVRYRILLVLLATLAVVATVISLWPGRDNPDATPSDKPTSPTGQSQSSQADTGSGKGEPLTKAPTVKWELFGQLPVPTSDKHGPTTYTDGTASGFTRSPEGALIAATQISARSGLNAPEKTWRATIENQFVDNADRESLLKAMRQADSSNADDNLGRISGFVYRSYTPETSSIELIMTVGNDHFSLSTAMEWSGTDWHMRAPSNGDWSSLMRHVATLQGVVEWGPHVQD